MMRQPVRVLQLGNPVGLYGAERWILALLRNSDPARVAFVVGVVQDAPGPTPPLCTVAASLGFRTQLFEGRGRLSLAAISQIRRFVVANDIHVVHTHGYKTDLLAALATRGLACKMVSTPHGWSMKAGMKLQVYEWLDRLAFACFDAVAPLSPDLHDGLARLPWLRDQLVLIPNGVDLTELDSSSAAPVARSAERVVGYVGQLIPRKGLTTLIRAFAGLGMPDVRLVIVGEGPQRTELEALVRQLELTDAVRFLGFRDDRIALMQSFDLFVLPSELEGIPRCLMESMALGVPAIASDIPGCRSLVEPGVTGELFPVGDSDALRRAITALLKEPERRARLAERGRDLVRSEYSAAAMSARYAQLYTGMLDDMPHAAATLSGGR